MATETEAAADDLTWGQIFKGATQSVLGVFIENEREPSSSSSSTASASPGSYAQGPADVHPLGLIAPSDGTPLGWLKANWVVALMAVVAVLVALAAAKSF